jgi:hypothetical protein
MEQKMTWEFCPNPFNGIAGSGYLLLSKTQLVKSFTPLLKNLSHTPYYTKQLGPSFVPVYTGDTWSKTNDEIGRSLSRFMTRRIGIVDILAQGNHTLSIKPNDDDSGGWIRLSKVKLIPVL